MSSGSHCCTSSKIVILPFSVESLISFYLLIHFFFWSFINGTPELRWFFYKLCESILSASEWESSSSSCFSFFNGQELPHLVPFDAHRVNFEEQRQVHRWISSQTSRFRSVICTVDPLQHYGSRLDSPINFWFHPRCQHQHLDQIQYQGFKNWF